MKDAGIDGVSVSVDGLEATHDRLRGRERSFRSCFETFEHFAAAGIHFNANTQINRLSAPELPALYERLRDAGVTGWQIQLTTAMGNAADRAWLILQPAELPDVYRMLARIATRSLHDRVRLMPGNNIGYFGPYDHLIFQSDRTWSGCMAGLAVLGIHADGSIKGCPTLPSEFVGGNIRTQTLDQILESRELTFNVTAGTAEGTSHMWGFCGDCPHKRSCRGGCSQTATVTMGKRGNDPFCHYRALTLASRGLRERIVPRLIAVGKPFDHGAFRLVEEPVDAPWPAADDHHFTYDRIDWPAGWEDWPEPSRTTTNSLD